MKNFQHNLYHRWLITFFSVMLGYGCVSAQLHLTVEKDTINFNETVTVTLSGEIKDISAFAELPESDGLIMIGRTENYSFNGNSGKIKLSQSFTMQPVKTGEFTIGPAWVIAGSKKIFSNKVNVTVKGGSTSSPSNTVFLRCEPDKKTAFLGEQITLTIRLYHRVDVRLSSDRPFAKAFNGFWYHSGPIDKIYKDTLITLNGLKYVGETLYKEFVFPNATGNLKIPSYEYSCSVRQNPFPTGDNLIDDMMGIDTPVQLHSSEVPIEVFPLKDENRPANFSGDVGKFSLASTIDKTAVKANEAVKLNVTISGRGNISFIQLPAQKFPDGIESFSPTPSDSTVVTEYGVEGSKTFSFTLIPKKEGKYIIPGISFSYYDPEKKEYVTLNTPDYTLNVAPGEIAKNVSENNLPDSFLTDKHGFSFWKISKIILYTGLFVLVLVLFLKRRKKIRKEEQLQNNAIAQEEENKKTQHEAELKNTPSGSMMPKLEQFMLKGNYVAAVSLLYTEFQNSICKKCELGPEEASIHQIKYRLKIKKFSDEFIERTITLLEELSRLRYSSSLLNHDLMVEKIQAVRSILLEMGY